MVRRPSRLRGAGDAAGDLAAIGDQDGFEHEAPALTCDARYLARGRRRRLGLGTLSAAPGMLRATGVAAWLWDASGRRRRRLGRRLGCAGWAASAAAFGSGGSAFMMLTGGIEADDGKSYLLDTGVPAGDSPRARSRPAAGGWALATGAGLSALGLVPGGGVARDIAVEDSAPSGWP